MRYDRGAGGAAGSTGPPGPASDLLSVLTSTPVAVTTTAALTGTAFGKMHVCSDAGSPANYTVTLPDPTSNAGKLIGFRMAPGLTKLVTLAQHASETIDGATSRMMWAGETANLLCDGTNWFKDSGKTIPMLCGIAFIQTHGSAQAIATSSNVLVLLDQMAYDNTGAMADTANNRIVIRRPGFYDYKGQIWWNTLSATLVNWFTTLNLNGSTLVSSGTSGVNTASPSFQCAGDGPLAAGDLITLIAFQDTGASQNLLGDPSGGTCFIHIQEIPKW